MQQRMGLSLPVLEEIMDGLRTAGMVEAQTVQDHIGQSYSMMAHRFAISGKGQQRAVEALSRSRYAGLAPVVMEQYVTLARKQSLRGSPASAEQILKAMAPFVLQPGVRESLARAFHSGRPALIYGDSGNGKTAIVDAYARSFGENVLIPGSLYVNGQTIRVFDPAVHKVADVVRTGGSSAPAGGILRGSSKPQDKRWLAVRRPVVVVGGELSAEDLELAYDTNGGFYQAPPHLKAQDGIFVIDDFGRQQVTPAALLNRWILPLERGYDLLALATGERMHVPFEMSILFSTNLSPSDLADEAFLRRIPYKVRLTNPTEADLAEIARRECRNRGLEADETAIQALIAAVFRPDRPAPKAVYPRDLFTIIEDGARYHGEQPRLTADEIAAACDVYFVQEHG
jgi:predicted ATPase with chaperone activity